MQAKREKLKIKFKKHKGKNGGGKTHTPVHIAEVLVVWIKMKIKTFENLAARFRDSEQTEETRTTKQNKPTKETRTTKQNKQTKEIRKKVWFLLPRVGLRIVYYIYLIWIDVTFYC